MIRHLMFPATSFLFVLVALGVSPNRADAAGECNNRTCDKHLEVCFATGGGPGTHCYDSGPICLWDVCEDS